MTVSLTLGDCVAVLRDRRGPLFDACVTDPPYHLTSIVKRFGAKGSAPAKRGRTGAYARASRGFMGQTWDGGDVAFKVETWRAIFDQMKPGAHLVAFSGTRTYHRMACAIEDAGFEIRDQLAWAYGSGFPKSHDMAKAIDMLRGVKGSVAPSGKRVRRIRPGADQDKSGSWEKLTDREYQPGQYVPASDEADDWQGWGTACKPAWEPICLARKPISESSVAANLLKWGTGALNIDACRIECGSGAGRWPANIMHDGSAEVLAAFPNSPGQQGVVTGNEPSSPFAHVYGDMPNRAGMAVPRGDAGSAARFFFSAKAGPLDRLGSAHATVKPVDLMRWLCRMIAPPGGLILDPFAGSGTTGIAAMADGFGCELIELEGRHAEDIERKLAYLRGEGRHTIVEHNAHRAPAQDAGPNILDDGVAA